MSVLGYLPWLPFLNSRGYLVETVDPSPIVRNWSEQLEWNEWGYLDYAAAGLASSVVELHARPNPNRNPPSTVRIRSA